MSLCYKNDKNPKETDHTGKVESQQVTASRAKSVFISAPPHSYTPHVQEVSRHRYNHSTHMSNYVGCLAGNECVCIFYEHCVSPVLPLPVCQKIKDECNYNCTGREIHT